MLQAKIALVGNPNCGKTTLFNALTGSNQRVGNWPGVTVEQKSGTFDVDEATVEVVDLPGIYALAAISEDEKVSLDYILTGESDLILNIVDGTNLERNLYLTSQIIEMRIPMIVIVNMLDIVKARNIDIDLDKLSERLGCPVYGISAIKKLDAHGIKEIILANVGRSKALCSKITLPYDTAITQWVNTNKGRFIKTAQQLNTPAEWVALRVLEGTASIVSLARDNGEYPEELQLQHDAAVAEISIVEARYRFTHDAVSAASAYIKSSSHMTEKIDSVVLNRYLGIPIFLIAMYLVFWFTLSIGGAFIDFFGIIAGAIFQDGFALLLGNIGAPEWLIAILASGVGAGLTTVATFIPVVFVMFSCLAILEDSGYMSRAAFVMDRFMYAIGLPGKSFVPMLVGFGCTVPAILAARTLESTRDKVLTIFVTPFMSCGAKLPVYAVFGAAFFGAESGVMVFSLYVIGGFFAVITGLLLKNTLFKGKPSRFIMELPPYHLPKPSSVFMSAFGRLKDFIIRAGQVIIVAIAVLGVLNSLNTDGSFGSTDSNTSILSAIGKRITPIVEPLGVEEDNWPATVALVTGLFAKEAIVGTLNGVSGQMAGSANDDVSATDEIEKFSLGGAFTSAFVALGDNLKGVAAGLLEPLGFSPLTKDDQKEIGAGDINTALFDSMHQMFSQGRLQVFAYLLFVLLYTPCMATIGAIYREIGGFYTALISGYTLLVAWSTATLFYQVTLGHKMLWTIAPIAILAIIIAVLKKLGEAPKKPVARDKGMKQTGCH